jgi:hypothetical protein
LPGFCLSVTVDRKLYRRCGPVAGLLSDIQGFFNAKFYGRYLSFLLRELARREAVPFGRALGLRPAEITQLKKGNLQVHVEHRLLVHGRTRFADLAVLRGGLPVVLVEVKEDDWRNKANGAQLSDYLAFLAQNPGVHFVHLSRYGLTDEDESLIVQARSDGVEVEKRTYRELFLALRKVRDPWATLIADYLEDIGVTVYKALSFSSPSGERTLPLLLTQMLGFPHSHGLGRLYSDGAIRELPSVMAVLFGNLQVLGDWIRSANQDCFSTRFTRKFKSQPYGNLAAMAKSADDPNDSPVLDKYIHSGYVYFYTQGRIAAEQMLKLS